MTVPDKIYNLDLTYNGTPMPFVMKSMEEIDELAAGITDDPHRHKYYSIIWSFTATGKHIIDFKEYPILPDHIFFVSPEQVHQVITDPKPTGYVILFTPEFLQKNSIRSDFISNLKLFQNSGETPPFPLNETMSSNLKIFANQMLQAFHSQDSMFLEKVGAYLKLFLIECNGHCSLQPSSNTQSVEVGKNIVRNFKDIVEKNYKNWHQVKNYADALFVSPNYLNEVIKTATNVSAKDFIQNRLILEAKRIAVFTDNSIKEIGFELGFDDPAHFSKFFKSHTSQSLQTFRESIS